MSIKMYVMRGQTNFLKLKQNIYDEGIANPVSIENNLRKISLTLTEVVIIIVNVVMTSFCMHWIATSST